MAKFFKKIGFEVKSILRSNNVILPINMDRIISKPTFYKKVKHSAPFLTQLLKNTKKATKIIKK